MPGIEIQRDNGQRHREITNVDIRNERINDILHDVCPQQRRFAKQISELQPRSEKPADLVVPCEQSGRCWFLGFRGREKQCRLF